MLRVVSLLKDSVIERIADAEDPISLVVEVGRPLLEAHVGGLDAAAVGALLSGVAAPEILDTRAPFAALSLASTLIGGCGRDACAGMSAQVLKRVLAVDRAAQWFCSDDDVAQHVGRAWCGVVRAACSRASDEALIGGAAAEVVAAAAVIGQKILDPELEAPRSQPALRTALELYGCVAALYPPGTARRCLDRAQDAVLAMIDNDELRPAAVELLETLWLRAASDHACRAASAMCTVINASLDDLVCLEDDSVAVTARRVGRRVEGLVQAVSAALTAAAGAAAGDFDAAAVFGTLRTLRTRLSDDEGVDDLTRNVVSLAAPSLRRAEARLLEAAFTALGPVARRRTTFLARTALESGLADTADTDTWLAEDWRPLAVSNIGLAARTLGAGLEPAAAPLAGFVTVFLLPRHNSVDSAQPPPKRRKKATTAPTNDGPRRDGHGTSRAPIAAFGTLSTLLHASMLAEADRRVLDVLARRVFLLATAPRDPNLIFWRDAPLRAAALAFAKATLLAPTAAGDRPPLVAVAKRAATLFDSDDAVHAVVAELRAVIDGLVRPRAPPFRPPRQLPDEPTQSEHRRSPVFNNGSVASRHVPPAPTANLDRSDATTHDDEPSTAHDFSVAGQPASIEIDEPSSTVEEPAARQDQSPTLEQPVATEDSPPAATADPSPTAERLVAMDTEEPAPSVEQPLAAQRAPEPWGQGAHDVDTVEARGDAPSPSSRMLDDCDTLEDAPAATATTNVGDSAAYDGDGAAETSPGSKTDVPPPGSDRQEADDDDDDDEFPAIVTSSQLSASATLYARL